MCAPSRIDVRGVVVGPSIQSVLFERHPQRSRRAEEQIGPVRYLIPLIHAHHGWQAKALQSHRLAPLAGHQPRTFRRLWEDMKIIGHWIKLEFIGRPLGNGIDLKNETVLEFGMLCPSSRP